MKLYERIENNNFDEIDRNRAIELIENGNGHLVYNENYFKLQKENEELKQEKINNHKMIALAQNEALGYMQGYEDGKNSRTSAIASIVENQQYYTIKKQMEKYEEHIEKLQKENEELKFKNKTLEELLQGNLYELYKYYKELANTYQGNCIPVQKVKDKIEGLNSRIEIYREYVEQGIETDVEWVDNVADRETVKVLQELLEGRE